MKSLSYVRLFATLGTAAHQAPLSIGFSRQEYWSGLPFPSPGDLPDPGTEPRSPTCQADAGRRFPGGSEVKASAWRIPCREEPGRLQSMGSQRVRHDWATSLSLSIIKWAEWVNEFAGNGGLIRIWIVKNRMSFPPKYSSDIFLPPTKFIEVQLTKLQNI